MTPEQSRLQRLENDFRQMRRLEGSVVHVTPVGQPPEKYLLDVKLRTIVSSRPEYRDIHRVEIVLPPGYPATKPLTRMVTEPYIFHPNWFTDGRWCSGNWSITEKLGDHVVRMLRTLQFDPAITEPEDPASGQARRWYENHLNEGIFPTDRQALPSPEAQKRKFVMKKFKMKVT